MLPPFCYNASLLGITHGIVGGTRKLIAPSTCGIGQGLGSRGGAKCACGVGVGLFAGAVAPCPLFSLANRGRIFCYRVI